MEGPFNASQVEILQSGADADIAPPSDLQAEVNSTQLTKNDWNIDELDYQEDGVPVDELAKVSITWSTQIGSQSGNDVIWIYRGDENALHQIWVDAGSTSKTLLLRKGNVYTIFVSSYMQVKRSEFSNLFVLQLKQEKIPVQISSGYLQYRTFADSSTSEYKGWLKFTKNDLPLPQDSNQAISLLDENGTTVQIKDAKFYDSTYYWGNWNNATQSVDYSEPYTQAGYKISFPQGTEIGSGSYTYNATTGDGDTLTYNLNYPGKKEMPTVALQPVKTSWDNNGSLTIDWPKPGGDFDEYMFVILDQQSYKDLLYVKLPKSQSSLTIPESVIKDLQNLYQSTSLQLQLQTRKYSNEGMNYARGITSKTIQF
jgi:hypothetical protein